MFYKNIIFLIIFLFLANCTVDNLVKNKPASSMINGYSNKGFALVYNDDLYKQKIVDRKMEDRSLIIFQKNLKFNMQVKITNILNNKSIIGKVGKNSKYPSFNNVVLSKRIAEELDIDINEPYVEVLEILENSIFVAAKAKTYEEEKSIGVKAPVNSISINDLKLSAKKRLTCKDTVCVFLLAK